LRRSSFRARASASALSCKDCFCRGLSKTSRGAAEACFCAEAAGLGGALSSL
jgi:hypothetical protein